MRIDRDLWRPYWQEGDYPSLPCPQCRAPLNFDNASLRVRTSAHNVQLVFCPVNYLNYAIDRSDDFVGGLCPAKRLRLLVVNFQVGADRLLQGDDGAVGASSQLVFGQAGEEAFDQIEPRTVGRREMAVKARVAEKPLPDPGRLVRAVIVEDQMDVEMRRDELIDVPQETDEIDAAVAALDLADDPAGRDIQGCEGRKSRMAMVTI